MGRLTAKAVFFKGLELNKIKILFNSVEAKLCFRLPRGHFGVSEPDGAFYPSNRKNRNDTFIVLRISIVSRPEFVSRSNSLLRNLSLLRSNLWLLITVHSRPEFSQIF